MFNVGQRSSAVVVDNPVDDVDKQVADVAVTRGEEHLIYKSSSDMLMVFVCICDLAMTRSQPLLGSARFETPLQAMKFSRAQKTYNGVQEAKLLFAETCPHEERCLLKIVSNIKTTWRPCSTGCGC